MTQKFLNHGEKDNPSGEMIIKEFQGFSGSRIYLMKSDSGLFVRKVGDELSIARNLERLTALADICPVPKIFSCSKTEIDMEYIHGLDIKTYLKINQSDNLIKFLLKTLGILSSQCIEKDYTSTYIKNLSDIEFSHDLPFTPHQLLDRLPKILPASNYCGDMTLENIIYTEDRGFYLIDCVTVDYDSYIFDIAKLRQDLECGWFIRGTTTALDLKTIHIQNQLLCQYPQANNDYILILMLLRVYRHTKFGSPERELLIRGIERLWK